MAEPVVQPIKNISFEANEGYAVNGPVGSVEGWQYYPANIGNRIVAEGLGNGMAARIGGENIGKTDFIRLSAPIFVAPETKSSTITFSTDLMVCAQSHTPQRDSFAWSFYDSAENHLCSLLFDAYTTLIYVINRGQDARKTSGTTFDINRVLRLDVHFDFGRGIWGATVNNLPVVSGESLPRSPVTLGYVDVTWELLSTHPNRENYCLFDNFQLTASPVFLPLASLPENVVFSSTFESSEGYRADRAIGGQHGWRANTSRDSYLLAPSTKLGRSVFPADRNGLGNELLIGAFPSPAYPQAVGIEEWVSHELPSTWPVSTNDTVEITCLISLGIGSDFSIQDDFLISFRDKSDFRRASVAWRTDAARIFVREGLLPYLETHEPFDDLAYYKLGVRFDFAAQNWSVFINDRRLHGFPRDLDLDPDKGIRWIDFIWLPQQTLFASQNFMIVDNVKVERWRQKRALDYRIGLIAGGPEPESRFKDLYLLGQPGRRYNLEQSNDLLSWTLTTSIVAISNLTQLRVETPLAGAPCFFRIVHH